MDDLQMKTIWDEICRRISARDGTLIKVVWLRVLAADLVSHEKFEQFVLALEQRGWLRFLPESNAFSGSIAFHVQPQ